MSQPIIGVAAAPFSVVTPATPWNLAGPTWYSANSAASLGSASRADQLTDPANSATTGEYVVDVDRTLLHVRPVLRSGVAGHIVTFNVWLWSQGPFNNTVTTGDAWSPWLAGRFTATFAGAGTATNGVSGGAVNATDIYCSNLAVVATYDRRGDYTTLWKIIQPAADDGSPAILQIDPMGAAKVSLEGRTTTNAELFNFSVKGLTAL